MSAQSWIMLTYKVPAEPGRNRLAIWRKIKALGAVYLQNGVCVVPKTDDHQRRLKLIENEIAKMGGDAVLMESIGLDRGQEEKIVSRFNTERNEAYLEFIERCDGFDAEIARESAAGKFSYAEIEENDEDLKKLRTWLEKIRNLDFFGASLGTDAKDRFARCAVVLDEYAQQVFDAQAENADPNREQRPPKNGDKAK